MTFSCKYSRDSYDYVIELSQSEHEEVLELRGQIVGKKKELSDLINMYRKLEPSRVYRTPKQIPLDDLLGP